MHESDDEKFVLWL